MPFVISRNDEDNFGMKISSSILHGIGARRQNFSSKKQLRKIHMWKRKKADDPAAFAMLFPPPN